MASEVRKELQSAVQLLRDVNNDLLAAGDDPSSLGIAFVDDDGDSASESDSEAEAYVAVGSLRARDKSGRFDDFTTAQLRRVFDTFDGDGDGALRFGEFRAFMGACGEQVDFDAVCDDEVAYKQSLCGRFEADVAGNMTFPGFCDVLSSMWHDEQLRDVCNHLGFIISRREASERHRFVRAWKSCDWKPHPHASRLGVLPATSARRLLDNAGLLLDPDAAMDVGVELATEFAAYVEKRLEDLGEGKKEDDDDLGDDSPSSGGTPACGVFPFSAAWQWWVHHGFDAARQQHEHKAALATPVGTSQALWTWGSTVARHLQGAWRLAQESLRHAIVAGKYNVSRVREPSQRCCTSVCDVAVGPEVPSGDDHVSIRIHTERCKPCGAAGYPEAPPNTKAVVAVALGARPDVDGSTLTDLAHSIGKILAAELVAPLQTSGLPCVPSTHAWADGGQVHIGLYFDCHPAALLDPLLHHLESMEPSFAEAFAELSNIVGDDSDPLLSQADIRARTRARGLAKLKPGPTKAGAIDTGSRSTVHNITCRVDLRHTVAQLIAKDFTLGDAVLSANTAVKLDMQLIGALAAGLETAVGYVGHALDARRPVVDDPEVSRASTEAAFASRRHTPLGHTGWGTNLLNRGLKFLQSCTALQELTTSFAVPSVRAVVRKSAWLAATLGDSRLSAVTAAVTTPGWLAGKLGGAQSRLYGVLRGLRDCAASVVGYAAVDAEGALPFAPPGTRAPVEEEVPPPAAAGDGALRSLRLLRGVLRVIKLLRSVDTVHVHVGEQAVVANCINCDIIAAASVGQH